MKRELDLIYKVQREVATLQSIVGLLEWDQGTAMPAGAARAKAEQLKTVKHLINKRLASDKLLRAVRKLKRCRLKARDAVVMAELEREIRKRRKVPRRLVRELAGQAVLTQEKWREARAKNRFERLRHSLEEMVELKKKQAGFLDKRREPYEALAQKYEPGIKVKLLEKVFDYLRFELTELLERIKSTEQYRKQRELRLSMPIDRQKHLVNDIIMRLGISDERVAIGVSLHPFSLKISRNDIRMTTRYTDATDSFFSALHEAGHALYDLGLPKQYNHTVVFDAASYGLHESQSLFWENMVGKSREFWNGYFPVYRKNLAKHMTEAAFFRQVNMVQPSPIRTSADEVTYCLHIIHRFELERELINGSLEVKDLRQAWNRKMVELLGIRPGSDNQGVLQDIHWAQGDFGYFPSYAIGMVYSAQLYRQMHKELKRARQQITRLEFEPIIAWLGRRVHEKGRTMPASEIIRRACGQDLNPQTLIEHLKGKYSGIYRKE